MGIFDEKGIPQIQRESVEASKIEFKSVIIIPQYNTWDVKILINVFSSDGKTPAGVIIGIYYDDERIATGTSDEWGEIKIKTENLSLPNPRNKEVFFEAIVKGLALSAKSESFVIGDTTYELVSQIENFVNVDNKFLMSKYLVTQEEYKEIMGVNPSHFWGEANLPVEKVSWFDAIEYCNKKSIKEGLQPVYTITGENVKIDRTKIGYRLPIEEEWKYAAKGGSLSKDFIYSGSKNSDEVAWYSLNSGNKTHPVGTKKPNELGIYDMSGNVWEWTESLYDSSKFITYGSSYYSDYDLSYYCINKPTDIYIDIGFRCMISLVALEQYLELLLKKPENFVNVDNKFLMSKYLVTQREYEEIMGANPSWFRGESNLPVEQVSWFDAINYCNKKSIKEGLEPVYTITSGLGWTITQNVEIDLTKNGYRLPTEEEWEYAAKGGSLSKGFIYSGSNNPGEVAWYSLNSGNKTHPVGTKKPNELGIYDMSGNVWEWTNSWFDSSNITRVLCGGGLSNDGSLIRVDSRGYDDPTFICSGCGFRVVQSL